MKEILCVVKIGIEIERGLLIDFIKPKRLKSGGFTDLQCIVALRNGVIKVIPSEFVNIKNVP